MMGDFLKGWAAGLARRPVRGSADDLTAVHARHVDQGRGRGAVGNEPDRPVAKQPVPATRVQAPVVAGGAWVIDPVGAEVLIPIAPADGVCLPVRVAQN